MMDILIARLDDAAIEQFIAELEPEFDPFYDDEPELPLALNILFH